MATPICCRVKKVDAGTGSKAAGEEGNGDAPKAQMASWMETEWAAESGEGGRVIQQRKRVGRHGETGAQQSNIRTCKKNHKEQKLRQKLSGGTRYIC